MKSQSLTSQTQTERKTGYNTRLAQWGLTSFIETLCFYCKFVLADNLVFQNPPLRQAWERYKQNKMKIPFILTIFVFSTFHLFGQEQKFFVNDSLFDFQTETCWPLTKKLQLTEFKNFDFQILKAEITDNHLVLNISYGGGCGPVYLKLYVDNSFDLKNESMIQLFPEFRDNDMCKAIRYRKVCFDLDELLKGRTNSLLLKIGKYDLTIPAK